MALFCEFRRIVSTQSQSSSSLCCCYVLHNKYHLFNDSILFSNIFHLHVYPLQTKSPFARGLTISLKQIYSKSNSFLAFSTCIFNASMVNCWRKPEFLFVETPNFFAIASISFRSSRGIRTLCATCVLYFGCFFLYLLNNPSGSLSVKTTSCGWRSSFFSTL